MGGMFWIDITEVRYKERVVVSTVMNLRVL